MIYSYIYSLNNIFSSTYIRNKKFRNFTKNFFVIRAPLRGGNHALFQKYFPPSKLQCEAKGQSLWRQSGVKLFNL